MAGAGEILVKRIRQHLRRLEPTSPEMLKALTAIGVRIHRSAAFHMDRQLQRRTGNLANSLFWQVRAEGDGGSVVVGSRSVPYAAIHEFGGTITRRSKKGLIHNATYKKRAYLKPAFDDNIDSTLETLRKVFDNA